MREGCRASGGSREGHVGVLPTGKPFCFAPSRTCILGLEVV